MLDISWARGFLILVFGFGVWSKMMLRATMHQNEDLCHTNGDCVLS